MAYQPSYDTDDSAVPEAVRIFFKRRLFELAGVVLFLVLIAAGVSLASWSVDDPSLNHALDRAARNWLGYPGTLGTPWHHYIIADSWIIPPEAVARPEPRPGRR